MSANKAPTELGKTSYNFSTGDTTASYNDTTCRGPFTNYKGYNFSAVLDGLSNTVAMGERAIGSKVTATPGKVKGGIAASNSSIGSSAANNQPIICLSALGTNGLYTPTTTTISVAGTVWATAFASMTGLTTILPPNGPSCMLAATDYANRTYSTASSFHPGGVHVVKCDGSVAFITDSIDTGNLALGGVTQGLSPYGVWGALGSKDGSETVELP